MYILNRFPKPLTTPSFLPPVYMPSFHIMAPCGMVLLVSLGDPCLCPCSILVPCPLSLFYPCPCPQPLSLSLYISLSPSCPGLYPCPFPLFLSPTIFHHCLILILPPFPWQTLYNSPATMFLVPALLRNSHSAIIALSRPPCPPILSQRPPPPSLVPCPSSATFPVTSSNFHLSCNPSSVPVPCPPFIPLILVLYVPLSPCPDSLVVPYDLSCAQHTLLHAVPPHVSPHCCPFPEPYIAALL